MIPKEEVKRILGLARLERPIEYVPESPPYAHRKAVEVDEKWLEYCRRKRWVRLVRKPFRFHHGRREMISDDLPAYGVYLCLTPAGEMELCEMELVPECELVAPVESAKVTRTGRPRKDETPKETLMIAALMSHHQVEEDGSVGNYEPVKVRDFCDGLRDGTGKRSFSAKTLSFFLQKVFGGHDKYCVICHRKEIGRRLLSMQGGDERRLAALSERDAQYREIDPRDQDLDD